MFSMCSELTPRAPVPDNRIPQLMQPCVLLGWWVGGAAGDGMGPDYWTSLNHLLADQARSLDMVDTTQEIIWRNQFCDDKVNSGAIIRQRAGWQNYF